MTVENYNNIEQLNSPPVWIVANYGIERAGKIWNSIQRIHDIAFSLENRQLLEQENPGIIAFFDALSNGYDPVKISGIEGSASYNYLCLGKCLEGSLGGRNIRIFRECTVRYSKQLRLKWDMAVPSGNSVTQFLSRIFVNLKDDQDEDSYYFEEEKLNSSETYISKARDVVQFSGLNLSNLLTRFATEFKQNLIFDQSDNIPPSLTLAKVPSLLSIFNIPPHSLPGKINNTQSFENYVSIAKAQAQEFHELMTIMHLGKFHGIFLGYVSKLRQLGDFKELSKNDMCILVALGYSLFDLDQITEIQE